jgi:5-methylcytosine-specific restriction endonuclease McrA
MGINIKVAVEAARRHLVETGRLTQLQAQNKTPQGLCNLLRLRYPDGSCPRGKSDKKRALISWFSTRNSIVEKSYMAEMRSLMASNQRDQRQIESATKSAIQHIKRTKKAAFQQANSDSFLSSYEWRKLRMEALKMYGARCQCCGASPADGAVMNVDHIKPRKLFPHLALSLDNLQILCHECNHGKGNWDMTDWRTPEVGINDLDEDAKAHLRSI